MTKRTKKSAKKEHKGMRMSDGMKQKYAELFTVALDAMEHAHYQKPWVSPHTGVPCNIYRKNKPYQGCNPFLLMMLMNLRGWTIPYFITKKAMQNEDGTLKYKGLTANASIRIGEDGMAEVDDNGLPVMDFEKRFPVFFFRPIRKDAKGNKVEDEDWENMTFDERNECKTFWYQTTYLVYNIEQTNFKELYPDEYKAMTETPPHEYERGESDEVLERMINGEWRCPIRFGGVRSCYHVIEDFISLPKREDFLGDEQFLATAIHEMIHSTGKELGRELKNEFGSQSYAVEELIAELAAACVCSMLGIGKLLDENHIAYVQNWREVLRTNKDVIPIVIDQVQRAVNYFFKKYDEVAATSGVKLLTAA